MKLTKACHLAVFLGVVLTSGALRLYLIDRQGLWEDELSSLALSTGHEVEQINKRKPTNAKGDSVCIYPGRKVPASYYQLLLKQEERPFSPQEVGSALLQGGDISPPLYYLALNLWTRGFGTLDSGLRSLSLFLYLLCLPWIWLLSLQISGPRAALFSCIIFAFCPASVHYSLEGRMYAMLWLFSLITMSGAIKLHRRGLEPGTFLIFAAGSTLGLWTHNFFLFVYIGCLLFLACCPGRLRPSACPLLIIPLLLVLPWYLNLVSIMSGPKPPLLWLGGRPRFISGLLAPCENFLFLAGAWGQMSVPIALIVGSAIGLLKSPWLPRRISLYITLLTTCAGPLAFDLLRDSHAVQESRYALAGLPLATIVIGLAASRLARHARWIFVTVLVITYLLVVRDDFWLTTRSHEPFQSIGKFIQTNMQSGDLVLVQTKAIPALLGIARYMPSDRLIAATNIEDLEKEDKVNFEALTNGANKILFVPIYPSNSSLKTWLSSRFTQAPLQPLITKPSDNFRVILFENHPQNDR